jgi:glycosyltransferase involved in cell wall biosynthesis
MAKLSVVISAYNEEKKIAKCLESVDFADEIVVVDNSSLDKTSEIASKYTKHIYKQKNDPSAIDLQKNFGFSKATGDWVLSLDADETVSKELAGEIKSVINNQKSETSGYMIPRKNFIFGEWIKHTGWYPDFQLRLFKKGRGKFSQRHVHEKLNVEGEIGKLENHIIHQNYESISQFMHRATDTYCPNEADYLINNGYVFSSFDAIRFPFDEFVSRFFQREGYKDGLHGLMLSILMAFYRFLVFAYIWEKKEFIKENGNDFLEKTEDEFRKAEKDLRFWFFNEKKKAITNPIKKNLYKVSGKIRL